MDNLAINSFPSCNEKEIIGKGKCFSLQGRLQKGEPACSHTQHCHAGAHQWSSSAWEKSGIQEHELLQIYGGVEEKRQTHDEERGIFSLFHFPTYL